MRYEDVSFGDTFEEILGDLCVEVNLNFRLWPGDDGLPADYNHGGTPPAPAEAEFISVDIIEVEDENGQIPVTAEIINAVQEHIDENLSSLEEDAFSHADEY